MGFNDDVDDVDVREGRDTSNKGYSQRDLKEYNRARARMRKAGDRRSVVAAINSGTVPGVTDVRMAFVENCDPEDLPMDQVQLLDQMNRKNLAIGTGLISLVEKFLLDPNVMETVIGCMTIKDARDLLDLGIKIQRSAVGGLGNRNPANDEAANRKNLAARCLKDPSLLDRLHEICVDDEVDAADVVEGVFVNVNQRKEILEVGEAVMGRGEVKGQEDRDSNGPHIPANTNIPAKPTANIIKKKRV